MHYTPALFGVLTYSWPTQISYTAKPCYQAPLLYLNNIICSSWDHTGSLALEEKLPLKVRHVISEETY